ncbi:MAG: hypothetical protein IJ643_01635 [Eubacterium sp.]|nr:hypothetical protein [Eubacterium sp.]
MRISKKILAIALSILMAVSMMPFTVLAATTTVNTISELETALTNASSGDTIQLGSDLDYSATYTERNARDYGREHVVDLKDCTLDLNGHTISTINATVEFCGNGATIKNGTFALVPKNTDGSYKEGSYALIIDNNGKYGETGTVTVNDVTCGGGINVCCATVELNNVTAASTPTKFYTVWAETDANVTINSGTYTDGQTGGKGVLATGTKTEGGATIEVKGGTFEASNKVVYNAEANSIKISGGTFSKEVATEYLADGAEYDATTGEVTQYVAEVNGVKYDTFEGALAAISNVTTATHSKAVDPTYQYKTYVANGTIKLLADTTSNGVIIGSGSDLTIDFNGKTLDINAKPVGSNGTESAAMQLLKDSDITFKNGTLTSTYTYAETDTEYIQRLIQNYANLTLDNMTVGMKGNFMDQMMMSNSNGNITITDSTVSAPDFTWLGYTDEQAADQLGAVAMSVGTFSTYTGVDVTVTDSTINGYVNIDNTGANGTAALTLNGGDVNGNIVDKSMNGATVTNNGSTVDGIPEGYEWSESGVLVEDTHSVAKIGDVKYDTLKEAWTEAQDGDTITLLQDCNGDGLIAPQGKFNTTGLTVNFNNHTYSVTGETVGSAGTETIGFQLLKNNKITFKNGTITGDSTTNRTLKRMIQNYSDLTLDNMTVEMVGLYYDQMTMSNCNGDVTITGSTVSAPDFSWANYTDEQAAESLGARAMTVGTFSTYAGVDVTVTDSTINGYVNVDNTGTSGGTAALTLNNSDVNGNIVDKSMNNSTVTNNGSTVDGIPAGYEWNASNVLAPVEDAFNLTVEDMIHMNLYVNADAYDADEITVTYSDPDKQNGGVKTETFAVSDLEHDAKGRYAVKILAAPAQMRDEVTVTAGSHTYTTTVAAYCEALIAQSNDANLVALAEAMLDYGKACSDEFNYNESAFATQAYYNTDDVTSALDTAAFVDTSSANNQFTSYAYIAKSVPALRIYLNTTEAEAAALGGNALVNNEATQIMVDPNGNVCVDITGIRAEDLDKEFTVEFNGGSISINALQFAKAKGGDLGRSMYNYYTAADAYFV